MFKHVSPQTGLFQWHFQWLKAVGLQLHGALSSFAQTRGPAIMSTADREVVNFSERQRGVVTESDLEQNFDLLQEVACSCFELWLKPTAKSEIPVLADFEAGLCEMSKCCMCSFLHLHHDKINYIPLSQGAMLLLSLRSNYHIEWYGRRGGKGKVRGPQLTFFVL